MVTYLLFLIFILLALMFVMGYESSKRKKIIGAFASEDFHVGKPFYMCQLNSDNKICVTKFMCDVIELRETGVRLGTGSIIQSSFDVTLCYSTKQKALDAMREQLFKRPMKSTALTNLREIYKTPNPLMTKPKKRN